jgi:hypothetical protein
MLTTVVPAAIGTACGYAYARFELEPDAFRRLAGMYAAAGAAAGILGLRVVSLFWAIIADYIQKKD